MHVEGQGEANDAGRNSPFPCETFSATLVSSSKLLQITSRGVGELKEHSLCFGQQFYESSFYLCKVFV